MAERVEQVTQTTQNPALGQTQTRSTEVREANARRSSVVARVIGFITTVVLVFLAVRFVLLLLGANTNNGFVEFILGATGWLVAPFNGIFGNPVEDVRFEPQTLVAMVVYSLVGYALTYIATIRQPKR